MTIPEDRRYKKFSWKGANFRICSNSFEIITEEIKKQRKLLEDYIKGYPSFLSALKPIPLLPDAPVVAKRMTEAAYMTGIGPMAAVAGIMAQLAVEAALQKGEREAIVENGGDMYIASKNPIVIALYAGKHTISGKLAFLIKPEAMPLAVCSSSGKMGHSLSFGKCDLATIVSRDAALSDAAATLACNAISSPNTIKPTLESVMKIKGISGILLVKDDKIGLAGDLPELIRHEDSNFQRKITKDKDGETGYQTKDCSDNIQFFPP